MSRTCGRLAALIAILTLTSPGLAAPAAPAIEPPLALVAAPPAAPDPALAALVGEYGPDGGLLTLGESGGALTVNGRGLTGAALGPDGSGRYRGQGAGGAPIVLAVQPGAVALNGQVLARRDIGAEAVAAIRSGLRADPAALRAAARAASPPAEPPPKRAFDLVDLTRVDTALRLDIRYASANNFMGFALYERPVAYLQRPAAQALGRVAAALRARGYGLMIHDAYRPWFVTKMFWDATPPASRIFVADPASGSRHNRGCAVDLTLYDMASGRPVEMTSRYDEMSPRAFADYPGGTGRQRWTRDLLRQAMEREGFSVYPQEWWHFDYKDWRDYGIGNVAFDALADAAR